MLLPEIYYSERIKAKSVKGKGVCDNVWGTPGISFQEPSPSGGTTRCLIIPVSSFDHTHEICYRPVLLDSVARFS